MINTMDRKQIFELVGTDSMLTIAGYLGAFEAEEHDIDSEEDFLDGVYSIAKRIAEYPRDADLDFWAEMQNGAEEWYHKRYQNS